MMTSNRDESFGLEAYLDIQAELDQWGESSPVYTPRHSPGLRHHCEDTLTAGTQTTPAAFRSRAPGGNVGGDVSENGGDALSTGAGAVMRRPLEVQTPYPLRGYAAMGEELDGQVVDGDDSVEVAERLIGDGTDSHRPYHDALLAYLQSRERISHTRQQGSNGSMIETDDDEAAQAAAMDDVETKFLGSLAVICLSRAGDDEGGTSDEEKNWSDASRNEGNFWNLLSTLRAAGLPSLFYCVDGETVPDLTLSKDPVGLADIAPADALATCLGGEDGEVASLPLRRLTAALEWIEACHARRFEEALDRDFDGSEDPILPPPRRRTMWPGTLEALQRQRGGPSSGTFHPDAPLRFAFGGGLEAQDEVDDARLMRACLMLFQAGRIEDAMTLVNDCGQPWRAASWAGREPLSSDGVGNPTRALWKATCRKISGKTAELANARTSSMANDGGTRALYPFLMYEAAILSLLSDDVDAALNNPVFRTWEDGVHIILRSELGIIEDDVLRSHGRARVEAAKTNGGHFPYPGTEFEGFDDDDSPQGHDGDLGAALEKMEGSSIESIRAGGCDPFRNGMTSFLMGQDALKEYIEECGALSLDVDIDDDTGLLRFMVHLILYVDTALPSFCSRLALPAGVDAMTDSCVFSLRELLILKYVAHLSSRRHLWPLVALYTSLLSDENILDTYSSFLVRVHSDRERRMMLNQARGLFPIGLDCYILRDVVRTMITSNRDDWARDPGEEAAPAGIDPADARMMRSVHWLCYFPEHVGWALVAANMLLRRFLLSSVGDEADASGLNLHAPKVFIERILTKDLIDVAMNQCQKEDETTAGSISLLLVQNLKAEYLSIDGYINAHTKYVQFLDAIATTPPYHNWNKLTIGSKSKHEVEIADKLEQNAFRQKKISLCKIILEFSTGASDALTEVLTFGGGWLLDVNDDLDDEETETEELRARPKELEVIRSEFVPRAVFMLQEVLDKTAMWLEQILYHTLVQFGNAGRDMLLALFGSFEETYVSGNDLNMDSLVASRASPGYWHKKALSLASIVANDFYSLHKIFSNDDMERFLSLMAESHVKLQKFLCLGQTFFDC